MTEASVITEDYVRERLARAVHALATADGPLSERLFSASLATSTLHPRDFVNEESRAEFGAIREMLTRHEPLASEGRVRATLDRMSNAEARAVADEVSPVTSEARTTIDRRRGGGRFNVGPRVSPDGTSVLWALKTPEARVVVDGVPGPVFDQVIAPAFAPKGARCARDCAAWRSRRSAAHRARARRTAPGTASAAGSGSR